MAADALERVELLEDQGDELEAEIARLERRRERAAARLDRVTGKLWKSLDGLRDAVAEAKGAGDSSASQAAAALADAASAARALAVLENRFDYHLRQHGGS